MHADNERKQILFDPAAAVQHFLSIEKKNSAFVITENGFENVEQLCMTLITCSDYG